MGALICGVGLAIAMVWLVIWMELDQEKPKGGEDRHHDHDGPDHS